MPHYDLKGLYDYQCEYTISPVCAVTAHNALEAAMLCNYESNCAAFILSQEVTWSGRHRVYLKSYFHKDSAERSQNMTLYYKSKNNERFIIGTTTTTPYKIFNFLAMP